MALVTRIPVPPEADATVRKVVLTDRYLVTGTVTGWITALDLQALEDGGEMDQSRYRKTFQADPLWDLDCRDDMIATANAKGTVTLWEAKSGSRKADLAGHLNVVKFVRMPPNQQIIVSGSRDTSIMVWDTQSTQRRSALTGHRERITMLEAFDNLLVSASADGGLRIWDLGTDLCVCTFQEQDGKIPSAFACDMNKNRTLLATGHVQGDVKIWSVDDLSCVATCHGHTSITVQISNARGNVLVSAAADGSIRSWDWATGNPIRTLDAHGGKCARGFVWTENLMISGGLDGGLHVWDSESWDFKFDLGELVHNVYHLVQKRELLGVALLLHSGSSVVELWDLTDLEKDGIRRGV